MGGKFESGYCLRKRNDTLVSVKLRVLVQYGLSWVIGLSLFYGLWTVGKAMGGGELQDFRVYYAALQDAWQKINPYQSTQYLFAFVYPPSALVLLWPITWFSIQTAETVWSLLSLAALVGTLAIITKNLQLKTQIYWWYFLSLAGMFWLFPVKFTFGMGQINLIVLLFMVAAWWADQKQKPVLAGILLGVAGALKLFPLIVMGTWLVQKKWLNVAITGLVFVALHLPAVLWFSPSILQEFYVTQLNGLPRIGNAVYYNQALTGVLARAEVPDNWAQGILLIFQGLFVVLMGWLSFHTQTIEKSWLLFSLWLSGWLLVGGLAWQHHFVWVIPGLLFLARYYWKQRKVNELGWLFFAATLIGYNFKTLPNPMFGWWLVGSHVFWGNVLLLGLLTKEILIGVPTPSLGLLNLWRPRPESDRRSSP